MISFTLPIVLIFIYTTYPLYHSEAATLRCKYDEQTLCGSDGFTYNNVCDLKIVQTVRPNLTMKYLGPCKARNGLLLNTLFKIIEVQNKNYMDKDNALRRKRHRFSKSPYTKRIQERPHKKHKSDLTRMLLSQMTNVQENINAFEFENNTISTQGSDNVFKIKFG